MKKYYMSIIDHSEIKNVTTDAAVIDRAKVRLHEVGILFDEDQINHDNLCEFVKSISGPFFAKLERRLQRRRGGIDEAFMLLHQFADCSEYNAMFYNIVIQYGFLEWQVPEVLTLLPACPEALIAFMEYFLTEFGAFIDEIHRPSGSEDGKEQDM